jgi:anti-sigma B factor antagonist
MTFKRTDREDLTRLWIEGSLDAVTVAEIRPTIESILGARPRRVIVDLSALRMIDSSGLGAIVSLYKRLRETGGDVNVVGVQDQPLAIFKLLRLDRIFSL